MKKPNSQGDDYSMQVADLLVGGAGAGHTETAHCLLVAGADPDCVVTCSGNTALHAAAEVRADKYHPSHFYIITRLLQCPEFYIIAINTSYMK